MVTGTPLQVPRAGPGSITVLCLHDAPPISVARIAAVTCVALTKVVVRGAPFQFATEPETKLLPLTVRVKAAPPAVALLGAKVVSTGTGFVVAPPTGVFISD